MILPAASGVTAPSMSRTLSRELACEATLLDVLALESADMATCPWHVPCSFTARSRCCWYCAGEGESSSARASR